MPGVAAERVFLLRCDLAAAAESVVPAGRLAAGGG